MLDSVLSVEPAWDTLSLCPSQHHHMHTLLHALAPNYPPTKKKPQKQKSGVLWFLNDQASQQHLGIGDISLPSSPSQSPPSLVSRAAWSGSACWTLPHCLQQRLLALPPLTEGKGWNSLVIHPGLSSFLPAQSHLRPSHLYALISVPRMPTLTSEGQNHTSKTSLRKKQRRLDFP